MYRWWRQAHKVVGIGAAFFLLVMAVTGFLLSLKGEIAWMRPPVGKAEKVESLAEVVSLDVVTQSALAVGRPDLRSVDDIDRIDYRPGKNIFKVISAKGYSEVQVDGKTGQVVAVGNRNDQLVEDIHDLSFFDERLRTTVSPVIALALAMMAISGVVIWTVPIFRRRKHAQSAGTQGKRGDSA
jgi:uncharacterized iron-regulated membrane protein